MDTVQTVHTRVAVITGASSGIGYATALEFAELGYNVVLVARREEALIKVAEECEGQGVQALAIAADVTDEAAVMRVADEAVLAFGHFNVWVNAAAVSMFAKFEDMPSDDFRRVIETNLFGYVYGSREALKQFKVMGRGTLINISSVVAAAPQPYTSAYTASKYAIRGLSESLRMELQLDGLQDDIDVCTVMPAAVDTNLFQNAANYTGREVQAQNPVYDPAYVAKKIAKLVEDPKREVIIGSAGKLMALEHTLAPEEYESFGARLVDADHLSDEPATNTSGNLYAPLEENDGMRGGWREKRMSADKLNMILGGVLAAGFGLAAAAAIASKRSQHNSN